MSVDKISNFDKFEESSYGEFRDAAKAGGDGVPHPVPGNKSPEFNRNPEEDEDEDWKKDDELLNDLSQIETFTETIKNALEGIDMNNISPYAKARIKDAMKSLKRAHIYMMDFKQGKFD